MVVIFEREIKEALSVIRNDLNKSINEISLKENLYDIGVDSINIIKIIIALEDKFNIIFFDEDIDSANWESMFKISELITKRRGENNNDLL